MQIQNHTEKTKHKEKHLSHLKYNDFYSDMIKPLLDKEEDFCILFYVLGTFQ